MARTPRTRGGAKSEPKTVAYGAEDGSAEIAESGSPAPEAIGAADAPNEESIFGLPTEAEEKELAEPPASLGQTVPEVPEPSDASLIPSAEDAALAEPPADSFDISPATVNEEGASRPFAASDWEPSTPAPALVGFAASEALRPGDAPTAGAAGSSAPAADEEERALAEPPASPGRAAPDMPDAFETGANSEVMPSAENATLAEPPPANDPDAFSSENDGDATHSAAPSDREASASEPTTADFAASESLAPDDAAAASESSAARAVEGETLSARDSDASRLGGLGVAQFPEPAPGAFAISDSLTPGENAAEAVAQNRTVYPEAETEILDPGVAATPVSASRADDVAGALEGPGVAATPVPSSAEPRPYGRASDAAAPVPTQAPRRGGSAFLAGVLGGIAALLFAGLLQYFGILPSVGAGRGGGGTGNLQAQVDGLKTELASLRQAGSGTAAADPALASQMETLKNEVAQLKAAPPAGTAATVPPELEQRLAAAEQKLAGSNAGPSAEQLAALSDKVGAAQTLAQNNDGAIKDVSTRVVSLEQNFSGVQGSVNALQTGMDALQKGMQAVQAQPRVALALAASALKDAADRGAPFAAELGTLGALAPDAPEIKQLQPYAASGVPTRAALLADWNSSVDAVLATENPPDENAGIMSRLMSGAGSLVSVRPIGAVEGTGTSAIVGRMQAAMDAGDLGKALSEYDTLPDAAKQAAAGFAEKARARLAVESLVDGAITNATKAAQG